MFCNLFFLKEFRDHNFSDFWTGSTTAAQIDKISEVTLAGYLKRSYLPRPNGGDLPSDFDPILPLTLSPKCCASFIRTHPDWPYDERDYYLSKLFQFLMVILDEKYRVFEPSGGANEVGMKIEGLLDLIPREVLPPGGDVDWYQLWWQIWKASLTSTLDETVNLLEGSLAELLDLSEGQLQKALDGEERPSRRYGPEPDWETHRRVYEIASKYPNWKQPEELAKFCEDLTDARIAVPPPWRKRKPPIEDWDMGLIDDKEATVKAIEYRLRQGKRVHSNSR